MVPSQSLPNLDLMAGVGKPSTPTNTHHSIEVTYKLYSKLLETINEAEKSKNTDPIKHLLDQTLI